MAGFYEVLRGTKGALLRCARARLRGNSHICMIQSHARYNAAEKYRFILIIYICYRVVTFFLYRVAMYARIVIVVDVEWSVSNEIFLSYLLETKLNVPQCISREEEWNICTKLSAQAEPVAVSKDEQNRF